MYGIIRKYYKSEDKLEIMETKTLEAIGFTKGEVKVYLALLELGETSTGPVVKKSKVTGSKVYEILNKLIEKGLVSYTIKEKTRYFQASSPRRLMDYVNKKEADLEKRKGEIQAIIPQLESISKSTEKSQTSHTFEGFQGIKTVFNLILEVSKPGEEYYAFSLGEEFNKKFKTFILNYHQKRIKNKIRVKIIASSKERKIFAELSKLSGLKIRYYPNPLPLGVFVFKDYVATFTFKDKPTAFLIKSNQVAESYKNFFTNLWKVSK